MVQVAFILSPLFFLTFLFAAADSVASPRQV